MVAKPWISQYPQGIAPELPPLQHRNLAEFVKSAAQAHGPARAFTMVLPNGMASGLSFLEVDRLSDRFAAYLRGPAGLASGDRVALQMPNCLAWPVAAFGVLKAGCVLVSANPLYTPEETKRQLADAEAQVLVASDLFADNARAALAGGGIRRAVLSGLADIFPRPKRWLVHGMLRHVSRKVPRADFPHERFLDALASAPADGVDASSADHGTLALLQYTGGTTGVPKGAMLTHGNILSNMLQVFQMIGGSLSAGRDVMLTVLPLYHIFAFTVNLLGVFHAGVHNLLIPSPRPLTNLKPVFAKYPVSLMTGVNTLYRALAAAPWFSERPPTHLRAAVSGGMPLDAAVAEAWASVTGVGLLEGYGMTEASPILSLNTLDGRGRPGTVGIPVPSTEMQLVDDAGIPVAAGEPGEIHVRGPQVMQGYWGNADETDKTLADGWLRTGDVGVFDDDGYLKIVDRKKDVIIVSGFNVYPAEVEAALASHPGVAEAGAFGVPDADTGQAVRALVVRNDPDLTVEALLDHARGSLAGYKVPRQVMFCEDLPRSAVGKLLRQQLAEWR